VANAAAWPVLSAGGSALDAAVAGCGAVEQDASVDSVGVGGIPDASGRVSLDACVMEGPDRCGGVCFLRGYSQAAQIARAVMDKTVHALLAGDGAAAFAARQGFAQHPTHLLTPQSIRAWQEWAAAQRAGGPPPAREGELPPMNVEERYAQAGGGEVKEPMHDTVCVLACDGRGQLGGAVTTSGLGFKVPGRVGDSPIVGHGLYVDQEVGAAACTGNGELIMGVCGSFLAVELLRAGKTPEQAARGVLERIGRSIAIKPEHQVGIIVVASPRLERLARAPVAQRVAALSLRPGFSTWLTSDEVVDEADAGALGGPVARRAFAASVL
jgi:isoaspartyl peptidase/L-asparaginase-like protein (Ntn-hydrolase superfamily)